MTTHTHHRITITLIAVSLAIFSSRAAADTIHLYSGVSSDGTYDDQIHMLTGPIDGPLTNDFSSPDTFAAAMNGSNAFIVTPNSAWAEFEDSPAQWISSDPNGGQGGAFTALYALSFNLPDFTTASFQVQLSVDQTLGTDADDGIFLNGIELTGSGGGDYSDIHTLDYDDVASLLQVGTNTLYFYNVNYGGPAGVLFDATLDYTPAPVPEPSIGALLSAVALCGLLVRRRIGAGVKFIVLTR